MPTNTGSAVTAVKHSRQKHYLLILQNTTLRTN